MLSKQNVAENKELCAIVKQYPLLYNRKHKDYPQQKARDEAWQAVAAAWGKTPAKCKIRWRNLRTAYARSINAYKTLRGPNPGKSYYLAQNINFLKPYLPKEAAAVVAVKVEDLVSVSESVALDPSIGRDSAAKENENSDNECFFQNILRQMQNMNETQKVTFFVDTVKKLTCALIIGIMEEQESRDSQQKIQDRLTQTGDILNTTPDGEVLAANEALSPDSYH